MKKGFTIIEVSLVLSIAGLIFLMAFVALPALRRSSDNTARRDDMTEFISAVKKYQTNNRGALPGGGDKITTAVEVDGYNSNGTILDNTWQGFYNKYLGQNFFDPSGEAYRLRIVKCGEKQSGETCNTENDNMENDYTLNYTILVKIGAKCSGAQAVGSDNPRNLAALYILDGAGIYCADT